MPARTIQQAFELALQHQQAGRFAEVERVCRQILAQQPGHADAMHLRGTIAAQTGQFEIAIDLIRKALAIKPSMPVAHSNLGNALSGLGKLDEAIAAYQNAIALDPRCAQAHYNLGNSFKKKGDTEQAIAAFRQAIAVNPRLAEAYCNLGIELTENGQLDEAIAAFRQAIALKPQYATAYSNLGAALKAKDQTDDAITALRRAVAIKPDYAVALTNLGVLLWKTRQHDEALAAYRRAVVVDPNHAEAHCYLGIALLKCRGELDSAVAALRRAIVLDPTLPDAHFGLGNALKDRGRIDEAMASYRRAMALNGEVAEVHSNLIFTMQYDPDSDAASIAEELRAWNRKHAEPLHEMHRPHQNDRATNRPLRIGYVSGDFRKHAVATNFLPLLKHHDRKQFWIACYSNVRSPDAVTEQIENLADQWRNVVDASDEDAAELIQRDEIDILVDLSLHTADNRLLLFARKPAPLQVTFAGYPGSTGLTAIDYRLSDIYLDPPGAPEDCYSEKTIRLPHSFWCYDPGDHHDVAVNPLPALTNGHITFGCLNNFCKINPPVLRLWSRVLRAVPDSKLILLVPAGISRRDTLEIFAKESIDPQRIEFFSRQSARDYMHLYHRIDVGLDTFPYNGHTTSLDSFWMGVPVVTRVEKTIVSRAGLCQLSNLKLEELIAPSDEQFVNIAAEMAGDLSKLKELRATLRQRMEQSPLMDAGGFAANIESAYREMWQSAAIPKVQISICSAGSGIVPDGVATTTRLRPARLAW